MLAPRQVQAGLLGQTVTATYNYPNISTVNTGPFNFLVGPGVELHCPPDIPFCGTISTPFSLDFTDTQIVYHYGPSVVAGFGPSAFNGFVFTNLNMGSPITGFTLSSFGFTGLDNSAVSFTANSLSINLQGALEAPTAGWTVTLQTVPEPSVAELIGAGLALLFACRRLRIGNRRAEPFC